MIKVFQGGKKRKRKNFFVILAPIRKGMLARICKLYINNETQINSGGLKKF